MSSREISSDLVFEIISRTRSLETLDICKTVSKEWNQMAYEANFMPLYCKRTKNVSGYFIQGMKHCEYISQFVSFDDDNDDDNQRPSSNSSRSIERFNNNMRILASSRQGILCCVREEYAKYQYFACKPTTGQWQRLPNPIRHSDTAGVAILVLRSRPNLHYKIVRLTNLLEKESRKNHHSYRCDMFDSDIWKWKRLHNVNLACYDLILPPNNSPSITVANSVYWLTRHNNVVQFREANESFRNFSLPKSVQNNAIYRTKELVEYQGKLGLICWREDNNLVELWLKELDRINNRTKIVWRKTMVVDVENIQKYAPPIGFYNAGITVLKADFEVIFHKLQDSSSRRVKLDQRMYSCEVFQFRSDFERVNLRGA